MGEHYWAQVRMKWPTDLPSPDVDKSIIEALVEEEPDGTPEEVARLTALHESIGSLYAILRDNNCSFSPDLGVDDDGEVTYEDDQASYGVSDDDIESIRSLCQAIGIPYHAYDEGKYEWAGQTVIWLPGMEVEYDRESGVDSTPLLGVGKFDEFCKDRTPEEALAAIREYLAGPDFDGAPRPTVLPT